MTLAPPNPAIHGVEESHPGRLAAECVGPPRSLQVVALDLDGTITHHDRLSDPVREALVEARRAGLILLLITGRTEQALRQVLPEADDLFDAVVTENGAIVELRGRTVYRADRLDPVLRQRLRHVGIPYEAGSRILSVAARHEAATLEQISELGSDLALQRNRTALMLSPAGADKGAGLRIALHHLGRSRHNLVAVGDAENDLSMFAVAEVSVAVSNAVARARAEADLVLTTPGDRGIIDLLKAIREDWPRHPPVSHTMTIGTQPGGCTPVALPRQGANVLIAGSSGGGKSHLAGLLVERWHTEGYRVLVVDIEGDYAGLSRLPGVAVMGYETPPGADVLRSLLQMEGSSVVVDLSEMPAAKVGTYLRRLPEAIMEMRRDLGVPHWVVIDEAHSLLGNGGCMYGALAPGDRGYALITYRPWELQSQDDLHFDAMLAVTPGPYDDGDVQLWDDRHHGVPIVLTARETPHVRHWHKYATTQLEPERWFWFTTPLGDVEAVAHNFREVADLIQDVPREVLLNHVRRHDLSRYFDGTKNSRLADRIRQIEDAALEADDATGQADRVALPHRLAEAITRVFGLDGEPSDLHRSPPA